MKSHVLITAAAAATVAALAPAAHAARSCGQYVSRQTGASFTGIKATGVSRKAAKIIVRTYDNGYGPTAGEPDRKSPGSFRCKDGPVIGTIDTYHFFVTCKAPGKGIAFRADLDPSSPDPAVR